MRKKKTRIPGATRIFILLAFFSVASCLCISQSSAQSSIPLYGLFEKSLTNTNSYSNPFHDVELNAVFTSPTGRTIDFFGFYDGDGNGGQNGNVWKQRFMPDELGTWSYSITFSDGSPGASGTFSCVSAGAKPGPLTPDPQNPHWFRTMSGEHFMPVAMYANCNYAPIDWQDAIQWCSSRGYNMLITSTLQISNWGDGWGNPTAFTTFRDEPYKEVNWDEYNIRMWKSWDDMIMAAGDEGIYIGPFDGPCGKYGGQEKYKYPPDELCFFGPYGSSSDEGLRDRFDTERNLKIIRYFVARQGAFWNLAYWSLGGTEVYDYCVDSQSEFDGYGEYFASITPFGRMITAQDCEQWHIENRRWLSALNIGSSRKFNTVQTAIQDGTTFPEWNSNDYNNPYWQNALPNNQLALDSYNGFPVMGTESLWEGQGRANQPLRIIWGFLAAGAHTMWADWRYDDGADGGRYGSIGRGWTPLKPLSEHLFQTNQLGVNTVGDEQLLIATNAMNQLEYWKMHPHNELVSGGTEAYCLAEPGRQYMVYAPSGGSVRLDLSSAPGVFDVRWLNPETGSYTGQTQADGGGVRTLGAPSYDDWVLFATQSSASCGDQTCQAWETCSSCPDDCGDCEYHWLEAEYPDTLTSPMQEDSNSAASEGGYIHVPNGNGDVMDPSQPGGQATYTVSIASPGEHVLWGRIRGPTGDDDSFFINTGSSGFRLWDVEYGTTEWAWDLANDRYVSDPVIFTLTSGTFTITVKQREDGTMLDKLLLTNDLSYAPSGLGEPAENLPNQCPCTLPEICCNERCVLPQCAQDSDCGTDTACRTWTCSNPGTCTATCSYQDITTCTDGDGCCPPGCTDQDDNDCNPPYCTGLTMLLHLDNSAAYGESPARAYDFSGTGNNGTLHGTPVHNPSGGRFSGAFQFDGQDDYISVNHDPSIDFSDESFTYAFWIRGNPSEVFFDDRLLVKGTSAGGCGAGRRYEARASEADSSFYFVTDDDSVKTEFFRGYSDYLDDTWHHLAFTRDASSNELKAYLDGYQNGVTETDGSGDLSNSCPLYFAKTSDDMAEQYTEIEFDDIAIWNRALSPQEIESLFTSNAPLSCGHSCVHRADIPPCDGKVTMPELNFFIGLWKLNSTEYPMRELMEAVTLYYNP